MRRYKLRMQQQAPMDFSWAGTSHTPHSAFIDHPCICIVRIRNGQETKNKKRNSSEDYLILIHIASQMGTNKRYEHAFKISKQRSPKLHQNLCISLKSCSYVILLSLKHWKTQEDSMFKVPHDKKLVKWWNWLKKINQAISSTSARFIFEAIQSYEMADQPPWSFRSENATIVMN